MSSAFEAGPENQRQPDGEPDDAAKREPVPAGERHADDAGSISRRSGAIRRAGAGSMGDPVLLGGGVLAERAAPGWLGLGLEDRVIAESPAAPRGLGDPSPGRPPPNLDPQAARRRRVRGRERQHADVAGRALRRRQSLELAEQSNVVLLVGGVRASIPTRPNAGPATERVDLETGIVGQGRQAGGPSGEPGLDARVRLEGEAVLDGLALDAEIVERDEVDAVDVEQLPQLSKLVGRVRRDDDASSGSCGHLVGGLSVPFRAVPRRQRRTVARAAACASNSFSRPVWARSRRLSTRARSNGLPSAVPWSSTYLPASVATTLKLET